ncbi:MAG: proton-conducting transporter membrane subunit, partial [Phycisphaeraceae bacterium]
MDAVWLLTLAVLAPLMAGVVTLFLPRSAIGLRVWIATAGPAAAFALVAAHVASVGVSVEPTASIPWIPSLHLNLAFLADGLGTFFALLVAGIGVLIMLYARAYFGPEPDDLYRFYPTLGLFTTAMLGIVVADYLLLTLLFWEMTSISSFLLIGWDRFDKKAVKLAMQAFFTTGLGGLAMFGGLLLLSLETDLWRWSEIYANGLTWDASLSWANPMLWAFVLIFFGAATKSAQWPFHYWLPGAMAAPTPVSAFLHSATMVKAGVFLTGRLFPVFAAMELWPWLIIPLGAVTMLLGAAIAINQ